MVCYLSLNLLASNSQAVSNVMSEAHTLPLTTSSMAVLDSGTLYTADEEDGSSSGASSRCSSQAGGIPPLGRVSMTDFLADHEDPASQSGVQPKHQVLKPATLLLDQLEADMIQCLRTLVPGSLELKDLCAKISIKALLHWIAANSSFEVSRLGEVTVPRMCFSTSASVSEQESDFFGHRLIS